MNSLLTPDDFMKEKPLSLEEKVNILFEDFKSNLQPLFSGNNLHYSPVNEKEYQDHPIFKNYWLKSYTNSDYGGQNHNFKNKEKIIESLELSKIWYSYSIYNPKNFDKIGVWINMNFYSEELGNSYYNLIKFSRDVYCSKEEIYKKGDIIVFDKYNKIVRPTTEEEITDIITNKKKF